jgi:hypothetical protein
MHQKIAYLLEWIFKGLKPLVQGRNEEAVQIKILKNGAVCDAALLA